MELTQEEIKRIKKLLEAKPIDRNSVKPVTEVVPGCGFCT